jgi:putative ABC transport system substrate-binding protein
MRFNHLRRREFITLLGGAAIVWPLVARAQQPKVWRIGLLRASTPPQRELDAFRRALAEQGFVEGRNVVLIHQGTDEPPDRVPALATALVNGGIDLIVADGGVAANAARTATGTIPIVMARSANPFEANLVQSLARPGGNVTGLSTQGVDITSKLMELLKEMVPGLARLAAISPPASHALFATAQDLAARSLGLTLTYIELPSAEVIDNSMRQAVAAGAQAGLLRGTPFFSTAQRKVIVERARDYRLPMMYEARDFVELGGFAAYGTDSVELYRRAAEFVAKILQGANPGDLPIEQPTKFEFVLNLKTAKALGLVLPETLLMRADEVIE